MLTRIEIDGFKSFDRFALDLNPFSVVVGPNAAGKSNLFDALRLLARLADTDVRSAAQEMRGDPIELFRTGADGMPARRVVFAVEVLLDREVLDPYGTRHQLKGVRLRYEIGIERRENDRHGLERLYLFREDAALIQRSEDRLFSGASSTLRRSLGAWAPATRKTPVLIKTEETSTGHTQIEVSQDGGQGRRRTIPLGEASASFLSTVRTAEEFPHLFALREELAAFRFLQLNPAAEREPSDMLAKDELLPDGSNLATVLARIKAESATSQQPDGLLIDIRRDLAALIPGVLGLEVRRNEGARRHQVFMMMRDNACFSSRVLSDGTLRVLALLTLLHDPRRRGVLCFEEPENGIHEARIEGLIGLLRSFCTDLAQGPREGETLSQIIVNTHSPVVMRHLRDDEIIVADMVAVADPGTGTRQRRTRMRTGITGEFPLTSADEREHRLTRIELDQILRDNTDPVN